jgi:hypothetical protein
VNAEFHAIAEARDFLLNPHCRLRYSYRLENERRQKEAAKEERRNVKEAAAEEEAERLRQKEARESTARKAKAYRKVAQEAAKAGAERLHRQRQAAEAAESAEQTYHHKQTKDPREKGEGTAADPARPDARQSAVPTIGRDGGNQKCRPCFVQPWMIRVGVSSVFLVIGILTGRSSSFQEGSIVLLALGSASLLAEILAQAVIVCEKRPEPSVGVLPSYIICYVIALVALLFAFLDRGATRVFGIILGVCISIPCMCCICSLDCGHHPNPRPWA